jgi:hypothetical protein
VRHEEREVGDVVLQLVSTEQLLFSPAKSSSMPGFWSSGQPLMIAFVPARLARFSVAKALTTVPRLQLVVVMPISFR